MISTTSETLFRLSNLNEKQIHLSFQLSSHKKIDFGSEDTSVFTQEVYVNDKMRVYKGLKLQIDKTKAQNTISDSSMNSIKELMDYVKSELMKSLNAGTDIASREAIAVNIEGVKDNIFMMANEEVEGEYIFAGSDSTVLPFVKDADGKVTYMGDAHTRRVAVEYNEYRNKGITGFDMAMYSSDTAYNGDKLTFSADERVVDQDNNEWKKPPVVSSGNVITFDSSQPILDESGKSWTLNAGIPQLEDGLGGTIPATQVSGSTYNVTVPTSPATPISLGIGQLIKHDIEGKITNEFKNIVQTKEATASTPAVFEFQNPISTPGNVFDAKHNIFDDLDNIIHALRNQKPDGNPTSGPGETRDLLSAELDHMLKSFDGMNVAHAKLGGKNKVFEIAASNISAKLNHYKIMQVNVSAADLTQAAIEAKSLEMTYTALYSTINKMSSLSLVNFIK